MRERFRVLVVDDNEPTRLLIARIISDELPVTVTLAGTTEEAQRRIHAQPFDLILLDLLMPGEGGFGVLEKLRNNGWRNRKTPVIVVTVMGDEDSIARCKALGATHYIVKPVLRQVLVAAVRKHLPRGGPAANANQADPQK
jgi:CheY-like chemotaxis protein